MKKRPVLFLWLMFITSLLTLPFLGWKAFKRFLPGTLFTAGIMMIESLLAVKFNWWKIFKKIPPYFINEFAFMAGPFFAGPLWILRLTYGRFFLYFVLNAVTDAVLVYPMNYFFEHIGILKMKKMNRHQLYVLCVAEAVLMYGFQWLWENLMKKKKEEDEITLQSPIP
ncbi:hypothetical protein [Sutcliffiella rhizosphaerae]|uniref:hypothetical protein n=1 Tax=Sutcliffiella rhizosphaerae TaxID=2880967 RepID=UPI001E2DEE67|nr:hypothetical protein [Sutcliffiella rhizosphaerae]